MTSRTWGFETVPGFSLDAAGLVALADLTTIARRTALSGSSQLTDAFVLCPGLHRQQAAVDLNCGEYPACAAMTSGYVFRIENPATVLYLQKISRTGQLTTVRVEDSSTGTNGKYCWLYSVQSLTVCVLLPYLVACLFTIVVLVLLVVQQDWWGLSTILVLVFARLCNVLVIQARVNKGGRWKGVREPGVKGDLLVLLSQDRWVRIKGDVDDIKAITSGQWMSESSFFEGATSALATVLVYLDAALASNTALTGKVMLLVLLITSAGLLAIANERTDVFQMHGRLLSVEGERTHYRRRLDMGNELVKQSGRRDWAIRLGIVLEEQDNLTKPEYGGVTM